MCSSVSLSEIDTSFWTLNDKEWVAERKSQWPKIAAMLTLKSSKAKTIIKQYFLKGKMPNWDMLADWGNYDRHLDLFVFLWLHPSWDKEVLQSLCRTYMASDAIILRDLQAGFTTLFNSGISEGSINYNGIIKESMIDTEGHNEILFSIMMKDSYKSSFQIARRFYYGESRIFEYLKNDLFDIHVMGRWLIIEKMTPVNNDMLYQYDAPLEWWYQSAQKEDYFKTCYQRENTINSVKKALWRIHHFTTDDKDKNDPRIAFVHKIRKILDERSFDKVFETIWEQVKAGEIQIENPWKNQWELP